MKHHPCLSHLVCAALGLALLTGNAPAHPGHYGRAADTSAFVAGFLHPFSGLDHMLLALATGWLAFSLGRRAAAAVITAFLAMLAVGALSGRGFSGSSFLEAGLSLTLIAAGGIMLAPTLRTAGILVAAAVAAGLIHGFAHGAETLPGLSFPACAAGFVVATALLVGMGGLLQAAVSRMTRPAMLLRPFGAALVALGLSALVRIL